MPWNMKQQQGKIIAAAVILCVLAAAYLWGGNYAGWDRSGRENTPISMAEPDRSQAAPEGSGSAPAVSGIDAGATEGDAPADPATPDTTAKADEAGKADEAAKPGAAESPGSPGPPAGKDQYLTDPVPEGQPVPVEPQAAVLKDTARTCTLSVRCDTILDNMAYLDQEKAELVPEDGVIFPTTEVTFQEGESVFDILQREMKQNKIHLEFRNTPAYNSAYIEGINNLYEFDVGELSGWMYKVNGWFPNYGASRYQLKEGDVVEWVYTCDLGRDVGGYYAVGGE